MIRKHQKNLIVDLPTLLDDDDIEDKIKEIIKKGEGRKVEFKSTMRMNLKTSQPGKEIEHKTFGILECRSSEKPIFLKDKNEEHFYIRSGPSSIKLQTSKILEYIEDRKA
jgi:hypothetical protein